MCALILFAGSRGRADQLQQQLAEGDGDASSGLPDAVSINELAKRPRVKLDAKLRKALLKVLTRLEEEDKVTELESQQQQLPRQRDLAAILPTARPVESGPSDAVTVAAPPKPTAAVVQGPDSSPRAAPSADVGGGTVVDFFEAPLLTAFTVQQDSAGVARRVIPIFTEPGQLERQKILALETRAEADGGDRNTVDAADGRELQLVKSVQLSQLGPQREPFEYERQLQQTAFLQQQQRAVQQQQFRQQPRFGPFVQQQPLRALRQPQQRAFGYGLPVPELPGDLDVVYKVLALNHVGRDAQYAIAPPRQPLF